MRFIFVLSFHLSLATVVLRLLLLLSVSQNNSRISIWNTFIYFSLTKKMERYEMCIYLDLNEMKPKYSWFAFFFYFIRLHNNWKTKTGEFLIIIIDLVKVILKAFRITLHFKTSFVFDWNGNNKTREETTDESKRRKTKKKNNQNNYEIAFPFNFFEIQIKN